MKTSDLFEETFLALTVNKMRSGLTMLGIVIGIGSVIAMVSVGQGAQNTINKNIQSIGANLVMVMPGFSRGVGQQVRSAAGSANTLTLDDANAISTQVQNVVAVAPEADTRKQVTATGTNTNTQITGTVASYPQVRNVQMDSGSFFTDQNVQEMSKVAVLGPTARDDLFGQGANAVGQSIRINNIDFLVIGVTQSKGGSGFGNADDVIYTPISVAQHYLIGDTAVSTINIEADNQNDMSSVEQQVTQLLLGRHNISNPQQADFQVLSQQDIVATASSITGTFTILLASIAGISLLVGGIGIMNMMLTTVTERTREIGLRKAIGASRSDISLQFLTESFMLTVIGGAVGVGLGWMASLVIAHFTGIATVVSWLSVAVAFGVSAIIGVVFGYYPARRASGLNPIEALRYE